MNRAMRQQVLHEMDFHCPACRAQWEYHAEREFKYEVVIALLFVAVTVVTLFFFNR